MKRLLTLILAFVLLLSLTMPAAAAGKMKASTMRLELIEGSASIQNSSGVSQSYTAGMRLYSGYTLTTSRDSYAYISLDDEKAVKLDMLTTVKLKQSGKKLQIQLVSGQVFADVTAPLSASETLEIRTSTMVTGIRGSSAVVTTWPTRGETDVRFLTGHGSVTDYAEDSDLNVSLIGGEGYRNEEGDGEKYVCGKGSYPAFALEEIESNEHLYNEILAEGRFDPEDLSEGLEEKYQQEAIERGLASAEETEPEEPYEPSDEPGVEPAAYSVSLPESGDFYSVTVVEYRDDGSCAFTVQALTGYEDSTFAVFANGVELTAVGGVYAVRDLTENVTVTVNAEKVLTEYTISYTLNDGVPGEIENPESYTIESDDITLIAPTREGYTFLGWMGTELAEAAADVTIPAGSTGDRSYEAVWAEVIPATYSVTWDLTNPNDYDWYDSLLCVLDTIPEDGLLPQDASYEVTGNVAVTEGDDFIFTVQAPYGYYFVFANGELLEPEEGYAEYGETYVLSAIGEDTAIEVKEGVTSWIPSSEEFTFEADLPDAFLEESDNGIMLTVPLGETVSFTLGGNVLVYLYDEQLKPVDGVYSFVADKKSELRFVPYLPVTDGSLDTLQSVLADAEEESKTVLIDCNIAFPEDADFAGFFAPVILAEGWKLTLAATVDINAAFTNNGTVEVLQYATLYINESSYFCNNGSITVNAHASLSNYGNLDNMETGVITLCGDTSLNSPQPAEMHNEGYVQDFGTLNCEGYLNNIGEYRLWTDDVGIFQTDGNRLVLPAHATVLYFTGELTLERGTTLYLNYAPLYFSSGAKLTVSDGAFVYIEVDSMSYVDTALVMDNGSELVLNGSITSNDAYGFRDNENRWTLEEVSDAPSLTYQVVIAAPVS